jgi:hypothetical protein
MKNGLILSLVAVFALLIGAGCASTPASPGITTTQLAADIINDSAQIQAGAAFSTRLALLAVSTSSRATATAEVHNIAVAIDDAVDTQSPTVAGFQTLIQTAIGNSNSVYAELAATIMDGSVGLVNAQLQAKYSSLSSDQQAQATLSLIRAISSGVASATVTPFTLQHKVTAPVGHSSAYQPRSHGVTSPFETQCWV